MLYFIIIVFLHDRNLHKISCCRTLINNYITSFVNTSVSGPVEEVNYTL